MEGSVKGERVLPFEIGLYGKHPRERRSLSKWKGYLKPLVMRAPKGGVFKSLKPYFGFFV
jgi:hypothetical protein